MPLEADMERPMVTDVLGPEALGHAALSVLGSRCQRDRAPRTKIVVSVPS